MSSLSQNPPLDHQNPNTLQRSPHPNPTESALQRKPSDMEIQPKTTESMIQKPPNHEKSSEGALLTDAWKHKDTLWKYVSNYKLLALGASSVVGLIGFALKSKSLRRAIVKRNMVKTKTMDIKGLTNLSFIPRQTIFQVWDKIVNHETSPKPMLLIEGYQGTGKSFLVKKYIEEASKVRPTLYISLRDFNPEKWKEIIGESMNFYPETFFISSKGMT